MELTKLEKFYADDAYCGFGGDFKPERYNEYVNFVKQNTVGKIIELGSGRGDAAYSLHLAGVKVTATDIYPQNAQKSFSEEGADIPVEFLNSNKIEKEDGSVENYCLYQVLEHIETPDQVFSEVYRTLKKGGRFVIVGPNLISPLTSLKSLVMAATGKWKVPWFKRTDGYTYPFGSTVLETFFFFVKNIFINFFKVILPFYRSPMFREPCLVKPAISDSDAVLMLNPMDTKAMLIKHGFKITAYQSQRKFGVFAGSTWIVAEK